MITPIRFNSKSPRILRIFFEDAPQSPRATMSSDNDGNHRTVLYEFLTRWVSSDTLDKCYIPNEVLDKLADYYDSDNYRPLFSRLYLMTMPHTDFEFKSLTITYLSGTLIVTYKDMLDTQITQAINVSDYYYKL